MSEEELIKAIDEIVESLHQQAISLQGVDDLPPKVSNFIAGVAILCKIYKDSDE